MKFRKSFLTDEDGFSAKDFLMVAVIGTYILEQIAAFVLSLMMEVNADSLTIIRSLDSIVLMIVGGVFGVQAVREFKTVPDIDYEVVNDDETSEETYPQK